MMETLRVQLTKEKAKQVREIAMKEYGHRKGAISMAVTKALDMWINQRGKGKVDWKKFDSLHGCLKDLKMSSVELQHTAFEVPRKR